MSFNWIPSGAVPEFLQFHISVREPKVKGNNIRHSRIGESSLLQLPHADVLFDTGPIIFEKSLEARREAQGFDRLLRVGPFHHQDTVLKEYGPYFMASAHYIKPGAGRYAREAGVKAFLDSGGAQLKFRKTSFVDPKEDIEIYNQSADVATALDVPSRTRLNQHRDVDLSRSDLEILALAQKNNNAIFAAGKTREDLLLMNVSHGCHGDDFRRYTDTVIDSVNFKGWALSFDSDVDPLCIWRGAVVLIREYEAAGQWLHLFGVSAGENIPVMAWLGRTVPTLTSDSSSWIQNMKFYRYQHNRYGRLESMVIGRDFTGKDTDLLAPYCTCKFCQIMKTFGAYRELGPNKKDPTSNTSNISYPALVAHNLIAIKESVQSWNDRAQRMNLREYLAEIRHCFPSGGRDIIQTIHYLECALANGPEYADRHASGDLIKKSFLKLES